MTHIFDFTTNLLENDWPVLIILAVIATIVVTAIIERRQEKKWDQAWAAADLEGKQAIIEALPDKTWSQSWRRECLEDELAELHQARKVEADCLRLHTSPGGLKRALLIEEATNRGITVRPMEDERDIKFKLAALDARERDARDVLLLDDLPKIN